MVREKSNCEVAVVGGGPAGLCAAIEASKAGAEVVLIDENERPGGQLFKQIHKFFGSKEHYAGKRGYDIGYSLLEECQKSGVRTLLNTTVWGIENGRLLGIQSDNFSSILEAHFVIVATGASENPLSFSGWTLPGVMGAGAAQTMMNVHRVLPGTKVLMVGSGNVGLIVSYQFLLAGADVVAVVEALPNIGGYFVHSAKLRRASVPILTRHTVLEVKGDNKVEEAIVSCVDGNFQPITGTERKIPSDLICVAIGLSPSTELCRMAGCKVAYLPDLGGHVPVHDNDMKTSVDTIYVAGDVAGVEEVSTAMEEGRLAGMVVAQKLGYIKHDLAEAEKRMIGERLNNLRSGPFGEIRHRTKKELLKFSGGGL